MSVSVGVAYGSLTFTLRGEREGEREGRKRGVLRYVLLCLYVAAAEPYAYVTWRTRGAKEHGRMRQRDQGAYKGMGRAWVVSVASYVGLLGSAERCVCLRACECGPVGPYMRVVDLYMVGWRVNTSGVWCVVSLRWSGLCVWRVGCRDKDFKGVVMVGAGCVLCGIGGDAG